MPDTLGKSMPPSPTAGAGVQKQKAEQTPETDAAQQRSRRRVRQSREHMSNELIWLLQQRLRAVSYWPHWRLRCRQPLLGHGTWELSGLDHSQSLTRRACHARFMCPAPAFCAWRRLLLICLKLLVGVCVRDGLAGCCFCLRMSHFCYFRF